MVSKSFHLSWSCCNYLTRFYLCEKIKFWRLVCFWCQKQMRRSNLNKRNDRRTFLQLILTIRWAAENSAYSSPAQAAWTASSTFISALHLNLQWYCDIIADGNSHGESVHVTQRASLCTAIRLEGEHSLPVFEIFWYWSTTSVSKLNRSIELRQSFSPVWSNPLQASENGKKWKIVFEGIQVT